MRDHATVGPAFWSGSTGRRMRTNKDARILATYLITGPSAHALGLYYLPIPTILHETGLTQDEFEGAMRWLSSEGVAFYDADREWVWVPRMAFFQLGETIKASDKKMPWIRRHIARFRGHGFHLQFLMAYGVPYNLAEEMALIDRAPAKPTEALPGEQKPLLKGHPTRQDQDPDQEQEGSLPPAHDPTGHAPDPEHREGLSTVPSLSAPRAPEQPAQAISGSSLRALFGRTYATAIGGKFEWQVVAGTAMYEKTEAFARILTPEDLPYLESTLRTVLQAAHDSQDDRDRERHFVFGTWAAKFPDLRDIAMGLRKPSPSPTRSSGARASPGQWEPKPVAPSAAATARYLDEQNTCSFHLEIPDKPSAEYVRWCRVCKRLGPRQRASSEPTEPTPIAAGAKP